jgi:hypothetical protein
VVSELGRDDAFSAAVLQKVLKDSNVFKLLKTDLAYIHANFSFLSQSVTKLVKATNNIRNRRYTEQSERLGR